ncbi:MAG: TRAP transporter substrate-binding protein DctP [Paracoccaceae bacterium]|jgi:TRAP-type transport system periplasmic protein|nr:TRAP transporter substrate-binding protein DctP [Paracoccaceae bacterium]
MKLHFITRLFVSVSSALIMFSMTTISVQAKTFLRANSQYAEIQPGSQIMTWWAEEIKTRTDGEVEIKLFFGGALGKAKENLALLQEQAIDIAMMSPGYFPAELPFHAAPNSIPMAMASVDQAFELMTRLLEEIPALDEEAKANGAKTLLFQHLNPYKMVCKTHIQTLDDMKGMKFRTWGKDLPRAIEAVGATPLTLFFPDIYEALASGNVDCIPVSMDVFLSYKWYEVAKHVHDITIWEGPTAGTWITRAAWDRLSPEHQKIVQQVSHEAMIKDRDMTIASGKAAIADLEAQGVQFHDFPAADAEKWLNAIPDFFSDFINDMEALGKGDDARKMIKIWKEVTL